MKNRNHYLRMRTKLIVKLMSTVETESKVSQTDLFCLVNQLNEKLIQVHFYEEVVQLVLINPGKVLLLWSYPPHLIDEYDFCPDQRILTHRLFGKPALGPSPPSGICSC